LAKLHQGNREAREAEPSFCPSPLPLFDPPLASKPAGRKPRRKAPSSPQELALHVYWSAGLEGHVLGSLAAETINLDEQRALRELQILEYQVQEAAARLLDEVWRINLRGTAHDENLAPHLAA
jgi:hypothetical protein